MVYIAGTVTLGVRSDGRVTAAHVISLMINAIGTVNCVLRFIADSL